MDYQMNAIKHCLNKVCIHVFSNDIYYECLMMTKSVLLAG